MPCARLVPKNGTRKKTSFLDKKLAVMLVVIGLAMAVPLTIAQVAPDPNGVWIPAGRITNQNDIPVMASFCPLETPACGRARADFGSDVDLDGSTVTVGSPYDGAVHIFEQGPTGWEPVASFTGSRGLGAEVAMASGVVAASEAFGNIIHLYERHGSDWIEARRLTVPGSECFGWSLDLNQEHLVASDPCRSLVHVYARASGWTVVDTISIQGVESLGFSVGISGSVVAASSAAGTFAFAIDAGGHAPSLVTADSGGFLAVDGDTLALFAGDGVSVYERRHAGWVKATSLLPQDASPFHEMSFFGWDLTLQGTTLVVGAFDDDSLPDSPENAESIEDICAAESGLTVCLPPRPGAAYVFTNGAEGWQQTAKLVGDPAGSHRFGTAVAIDESETLLLVGAPHKWVASIGGVVDGDPADTVHVFQRGGD